ncbi:MAG: pyruvate, phosphate dikinase/phosphoenolpyruvate synthase regulator [Phycisphaerales bacterium]|nr:pyruvate, phosphate dikinase/phosphoenolpyruvate synthase regulator [Phycisphaerales bacterium]
MTRTARKPTATSRRKKTKDKKKTADPRRWTLHIVSDASGHLAGHLTRTILMGFEDLHVTRKFHVFQTTAETIRTTITAIGRGRHLLVHAVAGSELKDAVVEACAERGIPELDLTGPFVEFLARHTGATAAVNAADLHRTSEGYFRRVAAIEFTAEHDDGRNLATIHNADVVVIGLSRVSKSPTSFLLGSMGLRTANVSIVREVGFPSELTRVKKKIIALTMQPRMLSEIRQRRLAESGIAGTDYSDLRSVIREVMWAEKTYRERGYPVIDTTGRTIEEITAEICKQLGLARAVIDT